MPAADPDARAGNARSVWQLVVRDGAQLADHPETMSRCAGEAPRTHAFEQANSADEPTRRTSSSWGSRASRQLTGSRATVRRANPSSCPRYSGNVLVLLIACCMKSSCHGVVKSHVEERIAIGVEETRRCRRASDRGTAARIAHGRGWGYENSTGRPSVIGIARFRNSCCSCRNAPVLLITTITCWILWMPFGSARPRRPTPSPSEAANCSVTAQRP